jgi:hypothetical protein
MCLGPLGLQQSQRGRNVEIWFGYNGISGSGGDSGTLGRYHTFVVAVERSNLELYYTAAFPSYRPPRFFDGFGPIAPEFGVFDETARDYRPDSQWQFIGRLPSYASFLDVKSAFEDYATRVEHAQFLYGPLGPNSNSYAFSFVEALGFPRPTPILPAPAWDMRLPMVGQPIYFEIETDLRVGSP